MPALPSDTNFTFQNPTIRSSASLWSAINNSDGLDWAGPCHDCGCTAPAVGLLPYRQAATALETKTVPSRTMARVLLMAIFDLLSDMVPPVLQRCAVSS